MEQIQKLRANAEERRTTALAQKEAAGAMHAIAHDLQARVAELARRIDTATVEEKRETVAALFPRRAPYGIRLSPDGRIEMVGVLPLGPEQPSGPGNLSGSQGNDPGDHSTAARRSDSRFAATGGEVIPFRLADSGVSEDSAGQAPTEVASRHMTTVPH
jgi:hypothetical protein